jgi:hypothetical protein
MMLSELKDVLKSVLSQKMIGWAVIGTAVIEFIISVLPVQQYSTKINVVSL